MRRAAVGLVVAIAAVGLGVPPPPARAATHQVRVEDNVFVPKLLEIEPGDTVVWSALRAGHTITADDGRFDFHPDRTLEVGEQVSWRFDVQGDVRYYCRIHGGPGGQGMSGLIRVGDPLRPPVPEKPTLVVPDDAPTIRDAAAGAQPGTQVLVRPGTYPEEVVVTVAGLAIRGLGAHPGEVVLSGGDSRDVGITVAARGVRIENLTINGYRSAGVAVGSVSGTVVADTVLRANGLYGVDARAPAGLTVRAARIREHGVAGIGVRDCEGCGVRIDDTTIEDNAAGVVAVAANGVVVRGNKLRGNAVGIVLRDVTGAQVMGNTLKDNDATDVWVAALSDGPEPPTGAGVSISGGRGTVVASNQITGHTYNVVITGPAAALEHRIVDNAVGEATHADLGWDGVGAGVCFGRNTSPRQGGPTADPPWAAALYDCGMPTTLGHPYPLITANLARHASASGYPA